MFSSEIGNRWKPVVLDTQEEYDFIKEGQKSLNNSVHYWIGGSSNANVTHNTVLNFADYIGNNSGKNGVIVQTTTIIWAWRAKWEHHILVYDGNTFKLEPQYHEYVAPAILCEQAINTTDLEFASAESCYKKIVGSPNNYSHYASKCKELGSGWKPAVLGTKVEHDFIRASQKGLSDAGDYFIGGSAASPINIDPFKYHVPVTEIPNGPVYSLTQSVYPVHVTTYDSNLMQNSNNQFGLVSAVPNVTPTGILREKAMV